MSIHTGINAGIIMSIKVSFNMSIFKSISIISALAGAHAHDY